MRSKKKSSGRPPELIKVDDFRKPSTDKDSRYEDRKQQEIRMVMEWTY